MPDLLTICISAFVAVFLLLTVLAILMRLITAIFPSPEKKTDAALISAITTTYQTIYPNTKITKIEESR
jgi:uncharacterized membrane protein